MALIRFDPFEEIQALQREFFGNDLIPASRTQVQLPATDIYTKDNQLILEAHLPHYDQKDVEVNIDHGVLEIRAEKHEKEEDKNKKYVLRESSSSFYRRVRLPEQTDTGKVEAHMDNGILKVTVPLKQLASPKKISIHSVKSKSAKK